MTSESPSTRPGPAPLPAFGAALAAAMDDHGPLCVGIDPHQGLLRAWGLPDTPAGLRDFALRTVEAVGGRVAAVKPQSAFFERHGSAGIAVLEEVLAALRQCGTLGILDVKRGDIGSTMAGYAQAYLAPGAPLATDAITVSPYLGYGSLAPALELAAAHRRGVFVLALTSNPEGAGLQHARGRDGLAVARGIVEGVAASNAAEAAAGRQEGGARGDGLGSVGLVIGATVGRAVTELGIDLQAAAGPLLAPGIGAQGAGARELEEVFGPARSQVLASTSRAVLGAGPQVDQLRCAALEAAAQAAQALRPARP
ncbi:orotidine-5'-phosphate decarboxylase [Actinomyces bowdenii]|uniref:Orotidine 5'-phosphate decarboxylase n=1 Tax=Actinomyces bowdenii TaxID=131109 RepID=A0A3P1UW57_9ACTO|nr:orotidine-5'-phosphate decarboxylase [Actinomyces bowdenii]RRD26219.1 orotidine-5'-phosphate decarboxylase [Actinomyces bowdenii]